MGKASTSPALYALIHDARRFVLRHRWIIEYAPLQIYLSALVFAPEKSIVWRQFEKCIPSWIQMKPKVQKIWSAALQSLEGHSNAVYSVAFSPDGKLVASASSDETVRLWDAVTGAALQRLEGHSNAVYSVAFSPDGKLVASASSDETVRLWDAVTGAALQRLEGHSDGVYSVAFSPDGKLVASASADETGAGQRASCDTDGHEQPGFSAEGSGQVRAGGRNRPTYPKIDPPALKSTRLP